MAYLELIKMEIRSLTIPWSKNKAGNSRNEDLNILRRIEELDKVNELSEYEHLERELQRIYDR